MTGKPSRRQIENIPLAGLGPNQRIQTRLKTDPAWIDELAAILADPAADLDAIEVFMDSENLCWVADGCHRVPAYEQAGRTEIPAFVTRGERRQAVEHALGANAVHGKQLSNADKRHKVEMALRDTEWKHWSAGEIARVCGLRHDFVAKVRNELLISDSDIKSSLPENLTDKQQAKWQSIIDKGGRPVLGKAKDGSTRVIDANKAGRGGGKSPAKAAVSTPAASSRAPIASTGAATTPGDSGAAAADEAVVAAANATVASDGVMRDRLGAVVPDHLRDIFGSEWLPRDAKVLEEWKTFASAPALIRHFTQYGQAFLPWLQVNYINDAIAAAAHNLEHAAGLAKSGQPFAVCQVCKGVRRKVNAKADDHCKACRNQGWMIEFRYNELVQAGEWPTHA